MVSESNSTEKPTRRELIITRVFNAPCERVFKAWTDPEYFRCWWGPKAFTTPYCKIDLRPGGVFHYCMRSPEGQEFWGKGIYQEIVEPERLVYLDSFADKDGNTVPATYYGMNAEWPTEAPVTITFTEHDGKTTLMLRSPNIPVGPDSEAAEIGWTESLEKLAECLAKEEVNPI